MTDSQVRVLLPLWATASAFRLVLDFVNTGQVGSDVDLGTVQNVLWLADFFQIHALQRECIDRHIAPQLTRHNVLTFLEDAFSKLSSCQEQQSRLWTGLGSDDPLTSDPFAQSQKFEEQIQQCIQAEDIWYEFFNCCLNTTAMNIDFMVRHKEQ